MSCSESFDQLLDKLRHGSDPFAPGHQRDSLKREIDQYRARCPGNSAHVLSLFLNYYLSRGKAPFRPLFRELQRLRLDSKSPSWLLVRVYSMLAALTLYDRNTPRTKNEWYRTRALRLAQAGRARDQEAIIFNNWFGASLEWRDLQLARKLAKSVRRLLAGLRLTTRRYPRVEETLSRFKTHEAKLFLRIAREKTGRTRTHLRQAATQCYEEAIAVRPSDTSRRVNLLVEWAEALLDLAIPTDTEQAEEILNRAIQSLDATVTDLSRAYFYQVRGKLRLITGNHLRELDPRAALLMWRDARDDFAKSIDIYQATGHPLGRQVSDLDQEARMRLAEYGTFPAEILESLNAFRQDYPAASKTLFVMMNYAGTRTHQRIFGTIKACLAQHGITAARAKDGEYHPNLFENVLTYIYGCGMGIAVFERIQSDEQNPNVGLEVGYMLALRKRVCLLKEKTVPRLQTDLLGKRYKEFDVQDLTRSIRGALKEWLTTRKRSTAFDSSSSWLTAGKGARDVGKQRRGRTVLGRGR